MIEQRLNALLAGADSLLLGLFKNALVGVYLIQRDRFIYVNRWLADRFGYTQEELCSGMGPADLTAPESRPHALREIERRMQGNEAASRYAFRGVCRDGKQIDVEVFGVRTEYAGAPAIIGILSDISEREAAMRSLADQLRFVERLIETIPGPLFYKDENGVYLGCNAAFEELIGMSREDIIGQTVYGVSRKSLADIYFAADKMLFDNPGTQTYEARVGGADGTMHDVVFYKATFNKADGALGGLVGVMLDITERKRLEETVWKQANFDALTGLPNHRLLRDRLGEHCKQAQRHGSGLALLFLDIDRFKDVNDTLGHDAGDRLLTLAARRIGGALRSTDMAARQGGDEFLVLLDDVDDPNVAAVVARNIIDALSTPFNIGDHEVFVSASIGIALYPQDTEDTDTLIRYADQAMYAVKAAGRGTFRYFSRAMQDHAARRIDIGHEMRKAVAQAQFEVHYQPIFDLRSGRVSKAEALLRWTHPRIGVIAPDEFIPIAEENGLIGGIGDWVLRQAIEAVRACAEVSRARPVQISVNASPRQFITGDCLKCVDTIANSGVPAALLALEVTEGMLLDDREMVTETLLAFRDAGIQVSIDDFGTGYSAMSYLKKFDIDYLKIDRSFVRDIAADPSDLSIAEAIIAMAHKLGLEVIAEGVETAEQRDLLAQAGCDYAQGYLFARPMPLAELLTFLAR